MRPRYHTPLRWNWFLARPGYLKFMVREVTAFFIVVELVFLLFFVRDLGTSQDAFAGVMAFCRNPIVMVMHAVILLAAVFHSVTWFNLTPKIMPMYVAEEKVPDMWAAIIMGYLPCAAVSGIVLWGVMG